MFDIVTKYPWFGVWGKPRYYLVWRNRYGYSIINEYENFQEAEKSYQDATGIY